MRIHHSLSVTHALEQLPRLAHLGIGAELYLEPAVLETWHSENWHALSSEYANVPLSFHAPFWNLDLLSSDPGIARLTQRRFEQTLHAVAQFTDARAEAIHIVLHSGIPHGRTHDEAVERAERLIPKLEELVSNASEVNAVWCLENTHEPNPESLKRILEALPDLRYCFDAAHARVFSRTPEPHPWLELNPAHLHLNDNHGEFDDHLALGTGVLKHENWLNQWASRGPMVLEVRGNPTSSVEWLHRTLGIENPRALEPRVLEALTVG
jgi:sugar phosphate isomerase/epimerase